MDYTLNDQQKMVQNVARNIARQELLPQAAEVDKKGLFPRDGLRALAQAGLLGMLVPEGAGGSGGDLLSYVIATEEVAQGCANTALILVTHIIACQGVLIGGSPSLKEQWLRPLLRGERLAAFAATETDAGSNVFAIATAAQKEGDGYRVNGAKTYITAAGEADLYVTVVRTAAAPGPQSLSLLAIAKGSPGVDVGRRFQRMGMNGTACGEVFFNNCPVPQANLLGQEGGYMPLAMPMLRVAMMGAAAMALGLAQASLNASIQHLKERVIAGQPLANYQALQCLVTDMSCQVEAMRQLVYWAACQPAAPGPPLPAFKAKLWATETALKVIDQAIQLHGGQGYSDEFPLERYYRDCRGLTLHFGPSEALKATHAQAMLGLLPF